MVSPQARKKAVSYLSSQHGLSERRSCGLTNANRTTCRYQSKEKEEAIENSLRKLANKRLSFGYRRLHILLQKEGWRINHKKVYRLYRKNNLAKRKRKKKKRQIQPRKPLEKASRPNQRWAMDFVSDSCTKGRKLRTLNIIDVFSRECVGIKVGRTLPSLKVIEELERLREERGLPEVITVDNGPEYTSKAIRKWAQEKGVHLDYITPGKPTENGYIESFNGKFREECLNQNWFQNISRAAKIIEEWRYDYNNQRPHSSLGYLTPKEYLRTKKEENLGKV